MKGSKSRSTIIIGVVVLLAVMAALWFLVLSPRMARAPELSSQTEQLATANLALQSEYNRNLVLMKEAPQAAKEAQLLFETMPQEADLPKVLEQITKAGTDAGMKPEDISLINTGIPMALANQAGGPAITPPPGVQVATMDISISAIGQQDQVLKFIENLQALDRALLIKSTFTGPAPDTGSDTDAKAAAAKRSVQVTGTMFVLESQLPDLVAQLDELLAAAQAGAPGSPSPGASPAASAGASADPSASASAPASTPAPAPLG